MNFSVPDETNNKAIRAMLFIIKKINASSSAQKQTRFETVMLERIERAGVFMKLNDALEESLSDIAGNFAENAIKAIANYGISLPGSQFKPGDLVTQREFLYMLARSTGWYMDYDVSDSFDNNLYSYLKGSGIVKEGDRKPSSVVSKQDAAVFIVRALKYNRIADLSTLFSLSFSDSSSILKSNYGYVAIAYGLKIIGDDEGAFNPNMSITRADAAVYIYNLLNIGF
jgi:hypothetical protein